MFRLENPFIVVPQHEHARLAGFLASHWGNERFDRPALSFPAFVAGVTFHDWYYGVLDEFPLDDLDGATRTDDWRHEWLAFHQRGADFRLEDPVTDAVAKMHIRRLVDDTDLPGADELRTKLDRRIRSRIAETQSPRDAFEWADRITCLCDLLAFDVFRKSRSKGSFVVLTRTNTSETQELTYTIETGQRIHVEPWPFDRPDLELTLIAHTRRGYPADSRPQLLSIRITPPMRGKAASEVH